MISVARRWEWRRAAAAGSRSPSPRAYRSHGDRNSNDIASGVIRARLRGSAKKVNTSSMGRATSWLRGQSIRGHGGLRKPGTSEVRRFVAAMHASCTSFVKCLYMVSFNAPCTRSSRPPLAPAFPCSSSGRGRRRYGVVEPVARPLAIGSTTTRRSRACARCARSSTRAGRRQPRRAAFARWTIADGRRDRRRSAASRRVRGPPSRPARAGAEAEAFVAAAATLDERGVEQALDEMFASGSFEQVTSEMVMPALVALGDALGRGPAGCRRRACRRGRGAAPAGHGVHGRRRADATATCAGRAAARRAARSGRAGFRDGRAARRGRRPLPGRGPARVRTGSKRSAGPRRGPSSSASSSDRDVEPAEHVGACRCGQPSRRPDRIRWCRRRRRSPTEGLEPALITAPRRPGWLGRCARDRLSSPAICGRG